MKIVLWNTKDNREIPYLSLQYEGDPCNADELIAAINQRLKKDYKPLWINDVTEVGDKLLILSYCDSGEVERKYNYEYARGRVELVADREVGNFTPATLYDHELANWIVLHGEDNKVKNTTPAQYFFFWPDFYKKKGRKKDDGNKKYQRI